MVKKEIIIDRSLLENKILKNNELQKIFGMSRTSVRNYFTDCLFIPDNGYSCRSEYKYIGNKIIEKYSK
jgi:hypothetical protein